MTGELVGINLKTSARAKFFLIAPELAGLAEQAKSMAGSSSTTSVSHHHALTSAVFTREEIRINATRNSFLQAFFLVFPKSVLTTSHGLQLAVVCIHQLFQ